MRKIYIELLFTVNCIEKREIKWKKRGRERPKFVKNMPENVKFRKRHLITYIKTLFARLFRENWCLLSKCTYLGPRQFYSHMKVVTIVKERKNRPPDQHALMENSLSNPTSLILFTNELQPVTVAEHHSSRLNKMRIFFLLHAYGLFAVAVYPPSLPHLPCSKRWLRK